MMYGVDFTLGCPLAQGEFTVSQSVPLEEDDIVPPVPTLSQARSAVYLLTRSTRDVAETLGANDEVARWAPGKRMLETGDRFRRALKGSFTGVDADLAVWPCLGLQEGFAMVRKLKVEALAPNNTSFAPSRTLTVK